MATRLHASMKGTKIADDVAGGIRKAGMASGRLNGGFIGDRRRSHAIAANVDKLSGIWPMSGLVPGIHTVTTSTTESVNQGYFTYPASYQVFVITSSTYLGGGYRWFPHYSSDGCGQSGMWPDGDMGPHTSSGGVLERSWTQVGYQGCSGWIFSVSESFGYYDWVYPPPVWNDNWVNVTTTTNTDYPTLDFFA